MSTSPENPDNITSQSPSGAPATALEGGAVLKPDVLASAALSNLKVEEFDINLEFFRGPMDLLLHLVQQKEVTIEEVEMSEVAEQYLQIVSQASQLDLDRASEYLVIAATLIAIKSQRLLPSDALPTSLDGLPEDIDPEYLEELRARLKEYEQTKKQARFLSRSAQLGVDTFGRRGRVEIEETEEEQELEVKNDGTDLARMFIALLNRVGETIKSYKVQLEPINVVQMMMSTLDNLKQGGIRNFSSLLKSHYSSNSKNGSGGQAAAKGIVIGSFISVLELMKRGLVSAAQESNRGEIRLELKMLEADELESGEGSTKKNSSSLASNLEVTLEKSLEEDPTILDQGDFQEEVKTGSEAK